VGGEETGDKPGSVARLLLGNHYRQWARVPTRGDRSVCGVGDSVARLEARVGREEPQASNGSLCEHYGGSSRATNLGRRGSRN